jgi:sulfhydrogenase subunit delta
MSKPTVAIFDFACCEGCQLQIVNLEEEAMSEHSDSYDIAIIEGSITRPEDEERLKKIRERAGILIALGACATIGGVNKLKNNFDLQEVRECVYADRAEMPHLATALTKAADEVVPVDYYIHGCPITQDEFKSVVRALALGKQPTIPTYPVCVECKARGTVCRYEYNEICLGVVTRAGCNAPCPTAGSWCFGCRGYAPDPNVDAAREVMEKYGKTVEDLQRRLTLFNSKQEPTNVEHG